MAIIPLKTNNNKTLLYMTTESKLEELQEEIDVLLENETDESLANWYINKKLPDSYIKMLAAVKVMYDHIYEEEYTKIYNKTLNHNATSNELNNNKFLTEIEKIIKTADKLK